MKDKIVFVVLHYLVIQDTIECIESIKQYIDTDRYHIVVVDNASPNQTGNLLEQKYQGDAKVVVLRNQKNLGFAAGNNVGYRYALQSFRPDYIALLNNDILMVQADLCEQLDQEYAKSNFAVLGPLVYTADGRCDSNPTSTVQISREDIVERLKFEKQRWCFVKCGLHNPIPFIKRICSRIMGKKSVVRKKDFLKRQEAVRLHGCCLFFSEPYFEKFPNGLDECSFLYHEEEILQVHLNKNKLLSVYQPKIQIYHKEDAATDAITGKRRAKVKFIYRMSLDSCKELLKVYDLYDKEYI